MRPSGQMSLYQGSCDSVQAPLILTVTFSCAASFKASADRRRRARGRRLGRLLQEGWSMTSTAPQGSGSQPVHLHELAETGLAGKLCRAARSAQLSPGSPASVVTGPQHDRMATVPQIAAQSAIVSATSGHQVDRQSKASGMRSMRVEGVARVETVHGVGQDQGARRPPDPTTRSSRRQ